ncbi:AcrR family transcriptional regulator [Mycobacterium frederiksbergense]|uniref:AcrR family transcriptional regulator n=1 Tax=Mycolicibacterium frederiksbergense TaxID=117567 RepID=A0ABT6KXS8_9MYCO|nr:TetR/AcrR family transcriptional regulator [Mycolicibacterium frederiksbergense]MDH6195438.1 AcrR family transcriptional regulator [Mycolicibacterium frederiksbergense]
METAEPAAAATRARLVQAAIKLFTRHGYAGTSLQMIADELGFTKAAIYYHFRTREQLLSAVVEPLLTQLQAVVETAERQRGAQARAEQMVRGYAELAVNNRALVSVLAGDPSVNDTLRAHPEWGSIIDRQMKLLADTDPGPAGMVKATVVYSGFAGAASPTSEPVAGDELYRLLVDTGRRILGLRASRRPKELDIQGISKGTR